MIAIKRAIKRATIPSLIYWAIEVLMLLFIEQATEEWMLPALLIFIIARLLLWSAPVFLSGFCWISGLIKPECAAKHIAVTNLIILLVNILPHLFWYHLTGGWY